MLREGLVWKKELRNVNVIKVVDKFSLSIQPWPWNGNMNIRPTRHYSF